jgi:hypothetical protein
MPRLRSFLTVTVAMILLIGWTAPALGGNPPFDTPVKGTVLNLNLERGTFDLKCDMGDWPSIPVMGVSLEGLQNGAKITCIYHGKAIRGNWPVTKIAPGWK